MVGVSASSYAIAYSHPMCPHMLHVMCSLFYTFSFHLCRRDGVGVSSLHWDVQKQPSSSRALAQRFFGISLRHMALETPLQLLLRNQLVY